MIGRTLAHYKIVAKIGEGGMGEVYRARDRQLDRDVAVKLLPEVWSRDSTRIRRLEREAKTLASLEHPNIATVHGFHEEDGLHFLVMELIEGTALTTGISNEGLPLDRLLDIGIPLADAISFAHARHVVHRDLKPANIMLDRSGRLRVLDFGLASLRAATPDDDEDVTLEALTVEGGIVGTVAYMAPEQLEGRAVDARADVFAIGIVLHELATGERPFRADSTAGMASAILRDEPAPLRELRPDLPADLARVVRRCLEKKVERRLQTALDVRNELEDLRAGIRTDGPIHDNEPSDLGQPQEGRMTVTTEHVRSLSSPIPRMVGDSMTYLDNERDSDVLVTLVHGIGGDQRDFADLLRQSPYRTTAISLYGFGPAARIRPPLPFADHNRLLSFLVEEIRLRIAPRIFVLAGHSSGADQVLQIMGSADGDRIRPDGLVLLGSVARPSSGTGVSSAYARMSDDPPGVLDTIRAVAANADSLPMWLTMHEYLVRSFGKFGTEVAPLREFSRGYIDSFRGEETFFELFRETLERVRNVRCVYAEDEREDVEYLLERHICDNALGSRFSEEMIVADAAERHIALASVEVLLPQLKEVVRHASG